MAMTAEQERELETRLRSAVVLLRDYLRSEFPMIPDDTMRDICSQEMEASVRAGEVNGRDLLVRIMARVRRELS